ncbi:MAG: NAD(+)/NADH kinase [Bacteroidales bacterium]|nr:NAD(+)/NADH kinase [Bacteroidales bacterium]
MKIAIFGTKITAECKSKVEEIIHSFVASGFELLIYNEFKKEIQSRSFSISNIPEFTLLQPNDAEIIISLGGDGTFLKCAHLCYKTNIPILGINFGKLGFLAQTNPDDIDFLIKNIKEKKYTIKQRSILDFSFTTNRKKISGIGLNEITLQKSNAVKLIKINVYIKKEFLCSFWADGVAVSTPTGSTGYSLSLGSPILSPDNKSIIITPIAPHTLSIRPIIIPDTETIVLEASGEYTDFLISNDYQSQTVQEPKATIKIKKSRQKISIVECPDTSFFKTLREKLKLGIDIRK